MSYYGFKSEVLARLDKLIALQEALAKLGMLQMATLDDIVAKVGAETTLVGGLKTFIQGLKDQLATVPNITPIQQAQIDGIMAQVDANSKSIADAMVANTPPAVVPPPAA